MIGKGISFLIGVVSLLLITSINGAFVIGSFSIILLVIVNLSFVSKQLAAVRYVNFFLAGLIWASFNIVFWVNHTSQLIQKPLKANVEGYICSIPEQKATRLQFDFCLEKVNEVAVERLVNNTLRFTWGQFIPAPEVPLRAGQYWRFYTKLKPPHGRYNPHGFDYQKWMLAQGYAGTGQIIKPELIVSSSFQSQYHQIRQFIYDKLTTLLLKNKHQGMLIALAMGERSRIEQEQWQVLQQSGTSHLLAISGLHVGVAAIWCYWLTLFLWKRSETLCLIFPAQKVAQIFSILGALSILLLSGLGLPAQRAFIMILIFVVSRWSGRHYSLLSVLGITMIVILLWHPFAVLSASFWLSFSAVLIIALCLIRQSNASNANLKKKLLNWLNINFVLYVAMLPITIIFFDMFSIVSIFANLVLIPIASFLLIPVLYFAMLMMLINDQLAEWLFVFSSQIMEMMYWFQYQLAQINLSSLDEPIAKALVLLVSLFLCLLLLPKRIVSKVIYLPIFVLSLLIVRNAENKNRFDNEQLRLIVFDIGQGLSIYIETAYGNILYDTGWGNNEYNLFESTVVPYLNSQAIKSIDKVIISHGDLDHSGGLTYVLENYHVEQLISGELLPGIETQDCHEYRSWQWGAVTFRFLSHLESNRREGNNASCVLSIESSLQNVLLTGDIEKAAEEALIKNNIMHYDVLVAPHHGSKTSSTHAFIDKVRPNEVIFSTGFNNQWQFPKQEIVKRYDAISSRVWITHELGAFEMILNINENKSSISSEKLNNPHFWH